MDKVGTPTSPKQHQSARYNNILLDEPGEVLHVCHLQSIQQDMPPLHGNYLDTFKETISALKGWRATVDNETQHIQHCGFLKECDTILTPADLKGLEESKPYRAGIKALNEAKAGKNSHFKNLQMHVIYS